MNIFKYLTDLSKNNSVIVYIILIITKKEINLLKLLIPLQVFHKCNKTFRGVEVHWAKPFFDNLQSIVAISEWPHLIANTIDKMLTFEA